MSAYEPPVSHHLHPSYGHKLLQSWASVDAVTPDALVYPLFVLPGSGEQPIASMPGQSRWGVADLVPALAEPVANGLRSVLLFGVVEEASKKDGRATAADDADAPVPAAIRALRAAYPDLFIITDLCLCGYTDHGHCGILHEDHSINNADSIARLAAIAVSFARAGAHMIAPSDMMDGRVGAIKAALKEAGFGSKVSVMSYAAKFASCFYGPFRDAAHSGMSFGDRSFYQLPPGSRMLATRAVARDVEEGADVVMVKPGMPYMDIIRDTANSVTLPVAVYQVSGEYAMLYHAATAGAFSLERAVMESLLCFKRAGATILITYFAPDVLKWMKASAATAAAHRS